MDLLAGPLRTTKHIDAATVDVCCVYLPYTLLHIIYRHYTIDEIIFYTLYTYAYYIHLCIRLAENARPSRILGARINYIVVHFILWNFTPYTRPHQAQQKRLYTHSENVRVMIVNTGAYVV